MPRLLLHHLPTEILSAIASWLPSECLLKLALLDSPLLAAKLFAPGCIREISIVPSELDWELQEWRPLLRPATHLERLKVHGGDSFLPIGHTERYTISVDLQGLELVSFHLHSLTIVAERLNCYAMSLEKFGTLGSELPYLKRLELDLKESECCKELLKKLPISLEDLTLHCQDSGTLLNASSLPATLTRLSSSFLSDSRSLTLPWFLDLQQLLPNLVELEVHLSLNPIIELNNVPRLSLSKPHSLEKNMPSADLGDNPSGEATLHDFGIERLAIIAGELPENLFLPPSVKSLKLAAHHETASPRLGNTLLPIGLTSLDLECTSENDFLPWGSFMPFSSITDLRVVGEPAFYINLHALPPQIRKLIVDTNLSYGEPDCLFSSSATHDKQEQAISNLPLSAFEFSDTLTELEILGFQFLRPCDIPALPQSITRLSFVIASVPTNPDNTWTDKDIMALAEHLKPSGEIKIACGSIIITQELPMGITKLDLTSYMNEHMARAMPSFRILCNWRLSSSILCSLPSSITELKLHYKDITITDSPFQYLTATTAAVMYHIARLPQLRTLSLNNLSTPSNEKGFDFNVLTSLPSLEYLHLFSCIIERAGFSFEKLPRGLLSFISTRLPRLGLGITEDRRALHPEGLPRSLTRLEIVNTTFDRAMIQPVHQWPQSLKTLKISSSGWHDIDVLNLKSYLTSDIICFLNGSIFTNGTHSTDLIKATMSSIATSLIKELAPIQVSSINLLRDTPLFLPDSVEYFLAAPTNNFPGMVLSSHSQLPLTWPSHLRVVNLPSTSALDLAHNYKWPQTLEFLLCSIVTWNVPNPFKYFPANVRELFISSQPFNMPQPIVRTQMEGIPRTLSKFRVPELSFPPSSMDLLPTTIQNLAFNSCDMWADHHVEDLICHLPSLDTLIIDQLCITGHFLTEDVTEVDTRSLSRVSPLIAEKLCVLSVSFYMSEKQPCKSWNPKISSINLINHLIPSFSCLGPLPENLLDLQIRMRDPLTGEIIKRLPRTLTTLKINCWTAALTDKSLGDLPAGLKTLDVFVSNFSQTKTLPRLALLPNGIQSLALNLGPLHFEHLEDLRTNLKSLMELKAPIAAELKQEVVSTALPGVKFNV